MCTQSYERYTLCPCQLKRGTFNKCSDPNCHSVSKPVYRTNAPYCFYHARATCAASASRKLFFARKGVTSSSPSSPLNIPATAPILGGIISGVPLSTAFAGSGIDFMDGKRVVVDDSSDDPDRGKFVSDQERWDLGREEDSAEFVERKEDSWVKMGSPRGEYWELSARARRGPWGRLGPLKTGREKSRTWVEWRKFRCAKEEAKAKAKEKGDQRSETESTSAKEESQLLSTTELEEFEAMALSDAMTPELSMPYLVSPDSKT